MSTSVANCLIAAAVAVTMEDKLGIVIPAAAVVLWFNEKIQFVPVRWSGGVIVWILDFWPLYYHIMILGKLITHTHAK